MAVASSPAEAFWAARHGVRAVKARRAEQATVYPSPLDWTMQHCRIAHPVLGRIPFRDVARDYQRALLADTSDRMLILKARQIGISQTLAFIVAYEAAVRGGTAVVVSRTGEQAALFLDYVYTAMIDAPHPKFVSENQRSLELENGGRVLTQGATRSAGRGIPGSLVVLDEFAWMERADDIFTSVMPTLSNGGRAVTCSTPFGRANRFYSLWASGDPAWSRHELPWWRREDWRADPTWKPSKVDEIGVEAFAQEYDCDFAISGSAVFKPEDIEAMFCLSSFEPVIAGHEYLSAWDIGRKQDACVGITLDVTEAPARIVAFERFLHANYPDQQQSIEDRHKAYPGKSIVESNGVGDPVIQNLTVKVDEFMTTARTKKDAIDALKLALEQQAIQSPPIPQLQRELTLYQREDANLVQDCVMALAMAAREIKVPGPQGGFY